MIPHMIHSPPHVHTQLLSAVRKQLASDHVLAALLDHHDQPSKLSVSLLETKPWASATFNGARHHLEMSLTHEGSGQPPTVQTERIISALQDIDMPLKGYALIDFRFAGAETRMDGSSARCHLHFDALTLDDTGEE